MGIKADKKQNLIALVRNHTLEDQFDPYMLRLSPADEEALRIRWDAAFIMIIPSAVTGQSTSAVF
jgi:hypothetical protein